MSSRTQQDIKAAQESEAYKMLGSFVKGLTGHAPVEGFAAAPKSVSITPKTEVKPSLSGSITNAFGTQYDMSDPAQVAGLNREIEEHKRGRLQAIDQKIAKSKVEPETSLPPNPPSEPANGAARLDPNATEDYKTAFGAGQKKMDDMLKYFGSQNNGENLQTWAKANPALAYKEFKKAGMAGKEPFAYNDVEFGKLKDNPAEAAKRAGIEKLYDGQVEQTDQEKAAQAFKNFYVDGLKGLNIGQYKDMDANSSSVDPSSLLEKSLDFNIPGLAGTLGNYSTADYGELLKKYPNVFSYK